MKIKITEAFIDYLQTIDDVYEFLKHYNLTKKWKVLILFAGMTADMKANKKIRPIVTEFLLRHFLLLFRLFLYHNVILKYLKI